MEIYLMRHGLAMSSASSTGGDDRDRTLTQAGVYEIRAAAKGLAQAGVRFDRVFSSPYRRAVETAQIMAAAWPEMPAVEPLDCLAAGLVPETLFSDLSDQGVSTSVLLVGHEPDMGFLAGDMIGLERGRSLRFSQGTIARIDLASWPPQRDGSLVWLLTARLAGTLAG